MNYPISPDSPVHRLFHKSSSPPSLPSPRCCRRRTKEAATTAKTQSSSRGKYVPEKSSSRPCPHPPPRGLSELRRGGIAGTRQCWVNVLHLTTRPWAGIRPARTVSPDLTGVAAAAGCYDDVGEAAVVGGAAGGGGVAAVGLPAHYSGAVFSE